MAKLLFLLLSSLFLISSSSVTAKDYQILRAHIKAEIKKNGRVSIEETRTYAFEGSYKWVSLEIEKRGFDQLSNVRVWSEGQPLPSSTDEAINSFEVEEKKKRFIIKTYFRAEDQEKTITISYDLEGALVSGNEWTEFYWTFLGNKWGRANQSILIELAFEEPTSFHVWADGKEDIQLERQINGWKLSATSDTKRDVIRVKTHFLTSFLFVPSPISGNISPEQAQDVHNNYLLEREYKSVRDAEWEEIGWILFWPVMLASLFVYYVFYRRNKPDFTGTDISKVYQNEPIHPALINFMLNSRISSAGALKASLMKLVFDGHISLTYTGKEKKKWHEDRPLVTVSILKPVSESAHSFEKSLFEFIKNRSTLYPYFDEIFKKDTSKVTKWYGEWTGLVKKEADLQNWYIKEASADRVYNALLQVGLAGIAFFVAIAIGPIGIFPLFICVTLALLSLAIYHKTAMGESIYRNMTASLKALKSLKKDKKPAPTEPNWSLFIWALAFDLSKEEIKYVSKNWPLDSIPNMHINHEVDLVGIPFVMDDLLVMTHGVYFGTAAGGGVGASGGAAGGGGGGGAG